MTGPRLSPRHAHTGRTDSKALLITRVLNNPLDISHRYRQYWADDAFLDLEEFCREDEGVALEMLLTELYEDEIEPTEEEKQTLIDLATGMGMSREGILFWPEPPER
ncbi:hypothetical protein [Propionibacterium australiense]|uniref:hypothetical protein n=1 Tax=Propionibacterium australiense TaxID=119981 RepID=UPI0011C47A68|nr:hypothetical protein [Propionibacterium australiense]